MEPPFWNIITPSQYEWERRGLDFIRAGLPNHDPYRAWANFEFQTADGAIYEVDLLVLTKQGFWLVEIKSWPGKVRGDVATWTRTHDGKTITEDNPVLLANRKAKALVSLLKSQQATRNIRVPWMEAVVFLSADDLQCELNGPALNRVLLQDRQAKDVTPERKGILAALLNRQGPGIEPDSRSLIDSNVAKALSRAMEQAGKREAGIKGDVDHFAALSFLRGLLLILKDSGYSGLVLVLDEIETIQRVRSDVREKGLNALRQLIDDIDGGRFPGLYLAITGTPAFYDGPQGIQRLEPLAQRLHVDFQTDARFDIGITTRLALKNFVAHGNALISGDRSDTASGNGSLMRLAPVAIKFGHLYDEQVKELSRLAEESSLPTHASEQCVSACRYLAIVLAALIHGEDRDQVLSPHWKPLKQLNDIKPLHPLIHEIAQGSFREKQPPAIQGSGWVVESLEASLWAFHNSSSFDEAVLRAVNLGDDADTTGAICGQLAGAYWGESGISESLRIGLARMDLLEEALRGMGAA